MFAACKPHFAELATPHKSLSWPGLVTVLTELFCKVTYSVEAFSLTYHRQFVRISMEVEQRL
jgi:hypothetical protein